VDDRYQSSADYGHTGRETLSTDSSRVPTMYAPNTESAQASIALGAVFAVMALQALLIIHMLQQTHFGGWHRISIILGAVIGICGGVVILVSAAIGLAFGIIGIAAARRAGRPIALGLAGVLLNGLDLLLWLAAMIAWIAVLAG
jgi:hypothetical protein